MLLHPGSFVLDDLRRHSVDLQYAVLQTEGSIPTSTVIVNEASGSRTILHAYRFVQLSALCQLLSLPSSRSEDRTLLLSQARVLQRTLPTPGGGLGYV